MQTIYHYTISRKCIPSVFNIMIRNSISIAGEISSPNGFITISFLYDAEENLLHVDHFKGVNFPIFNNPITPDQLSSFLQVSNMKIHIKSKILYTVENDVNMVTEYIKDYSQMITELEKRNIVTTRDSGSFLAQDSRMFKFIEQIDDIEPVEWTVDCLGTSFCQNITAVVEREFDLISSKRI